MKKKIIAIVLAVALVAAVAAAVIISSKNKIAVDNTGSLYDYDVKKSGKGYEITVSGDFTDGFGWVCSTEGAVNCEQSETSENKVSYKVESSNQGKGFVTLVLAKENGILDDEIYQIAFSFKTDADGSFTFESNGHTELNAAVYSPSDAECAYAYKLNNDGTVTFVIDDIGFGNFNNGNPEIAECRRAAAAEKAQAAEQKTSFADFARVTVDVVPVSAGKDVLKFCNNEKGRAISVTLEVTAENVVKINDVVFEDCEKIENTTEPEAVASEESEAAANALKIPDGYELKEKQAFVITYGDELKKADCICAVMTAGNDTVYYYCADDISLDDFTRYICSNQGDAEDAAVGSASAKVSLEELGYTVVWENGSGDSFACVCANKDTAIKCAAQLYELNPSVSY